MNEKLIQNIENVDWGEPESVISFYEKNQLYFDNYSVVKDLDTIIEITHIKLSYIEALEYKMHYSKADKYLRHVDILLQNLRESEDFKQIHERYLFAFAMVAHRLKRYEESQSYFKELIFIDPENDNYKDWYETNKNRIFSKKSHIIGNIGLGLMLLNFSLDYFYDSGFGSKFNSFAIIIMLFGFFAPDLKKMLTKVNDFLNK